MVQRAPTCNCQEIQKLKPNAKIKNSKNKPDTSLPAHCNSKLLLCPLPWVWNSAALRRLADMSVPLLCAFYHNSHRRRSPLIIDYRFITIDDRESPGGWVGSLHRGVNELTELTELTGIRSISNLYLKLVYPCIGYICNCRIKTRSILSHKYKVGYSITMSVGVF